MKRSDSSGCGSTLFKCFLVMCAIGGISSFFQYIYESFGAAGVLISIGIIVAIACIYFSRLSSRRSRSSHEDTRPETWDSPPVRSGASGYVSRAPVKSSPRRVARSPKPIGRYYSYSGYYKYCPVCGVRNPYGVWYCVECDFHFREDEQGSEKPFRANSFEDWLAPNFYTKYQRTRFERAKLQNLPITDISDSGEVFTVLSSDGDNEYTVSCSRCTCQDFANRQLPCKHMYAVMLEQGILSPDFYMFTMPRNLKERIDILCDSSAEAAGALYQFLLNPSVYSGIVFVDSDHPVFPHIDPISSLSLLEAVETDAVLLISFIEKKFTIPDFKDSCRSVQPDIRFPSLKKHDMIEFLLSQSPALSDYFSGMFRCVRVPEEVAQNISEILECLCPSNNEAED